MISPADIEKIQFSPTRIKEGYDQNEVDTFLDRVQEDYAKALADVERWRLEAERLKRLLDAAADTPTAVLPKTPAGSAEKILVLAQRTADQLQADANSEAGQIRAAANADADGIRAVARNEAAAITAEAEEQRQKTLNALEERKAQLDDDIKQLQARRITIKSLLQSTLEKLEAADDV